MSMQITGLGPFEHINEKKARLAAGIGLLVLILALLYPFMVQPDPPPGQVGILINLGIPDVGQGDENAPPPAAAEEAVAEPVEQEEEPEEEIVEKKPEREKVKEAPKKEVVKTEDPNAIALRKKKEREAKAKQEARDKAAREAKLKQAKIDAEKRAKAKAAADAKAKLDAEKAAADALKNSLGGGFGGGKGNNNKPGNDGGNGDPSGLGSVGGGSGAVQGFGDRKGNSPGRLTDKSQSTGKVYVKICVDSDGNVISAKKTLVGTTVTDTNLHRKAEAHAKRYKFAKSSNPKQCGTIVYDFKFRG